MERIPLWLTAVFFLLAGCAGTSSQSGPVVDYREPKFDIVETGDVVYGASLSPDGGEVELVLDLFEPAGEPRDPAPAAFVLIHGGGFRKGSRTDQNIVAIARALAARGWIVASIDYRLLRDTGAAEIPQRYAGLSELPWFMAAAAEDAWKATEWLQRNTDADPDRTFIGGSSAGGITAMTLAYSAENLGLIDAPRFAGVVGLWGPSFQAEHVDPGDPPAFLVHGTGDRVVPWVLTEEFVEAAERAGVAYEFHSLPGVGHGYGSTGFFVSGPEPDVTYLDRLLEFGADYATDPAD